MRSRLGAADVLKDLDAVSNLVNADAVVVAHPSVPAKSIEDLVALAKAQPGKQPSGSPSPEEFGKFFRADFERNAKLVQLAGVKPE